MITFDKSSQLVRPDLMSVSVPPVNSDENTIFLSVNRATGQQVTCFCYGKYFIHE